ncbi:hypothetical protein ID866_10643, partial [Astraeus odoratus]
MPIDNASDPKCANSLYNLNRLGKRDGTVYVQKRGQYYITTVVTSSSSTFDILVDTGSSYTWVGGREGNPYVEGYASHPTPQFVDAYYAGGLVHLRANTYRDLVVLDGLTVNPQEIGVAVELSGFPARLDGVLGLGPARLNTKITEDGTVIPTVVDNLHGQGTISSPVLGVYLVPVNEANVGGGGLLSFGSVDTSVLTSDVRYVPVTQTYPASEFWGVDASILYGNEQILSPTSGILDTGAVRIFVSGASHVILIDAFMTYQATTGAVVDFFDNNRRLTITQDQYNNLQP